MIPKTSIIITDIEITEQPSKTYKLDMDNRLITGYCDGINAVKQAVYKILGTERYQYIIYSWNYGVELQDLIGEQPSYAIPEIERRITEALTQDVRILGVDAFSFDVSKDKINVTFTVHTVYGDIIVERVVEV